MKLGYAIIYVDDVTSTVEFYEKALGLKRRFIGPEGDYAEMETGATALAFASNDFVSKMLPIEYHRNAKDKKPAGIEITLVTDDVESAYKSALDNGAIKVSDPVRKPWGQTVSYLRDCNGVLVEIATPIN